MTISLRPVTIHNRGDLEDIDAGDPQRYWVHSPWYWHQWSLDNPQITFRLVHSSDAESAVGMVAYGPLFEDEALTKSVPGAYELIHLVVDHRAQRRGIGQVVAESVIATLRAQPDCERVFIAHHPDNAVSGAFFTALGFMPSDRVNYDGDPMRVLEGRG
jgi:ribosomal protein S18 acetylase RimI-like enzyme